MTYGTARDARACPVVELDAVAFAYPRRSEPIIRDVTFRLERGQTAAIVGPSGSGKTTLLSVVGQLLQPTAGSVRMPETTTTVAWVTQTTNVLGRRSVRDNAALGAFLGGTEWVAACKRAHGALIRVGLEQQACQQARHLSGGELQRLCIARALAMQAELVLADEPTGQLDRTTSQAVIEMLLAVCDRGAGLLIATHDLVLARRCDGLLALVDGQLQPANEVGKP